MKPLANKYGVKAICPNCSTVSFFDWREGGRDLGFILLEKNLLYNNKTFRRIHYRLLKCSGCGLAGLAKFHDKVRFPL